MYERKTASDRDPRWKIDTKKTYKEVFLKGINSGTDSAFCPGIIKYLKRDAYDVIVLGVYSTPTAMLAIEYLRVMKIPFVMNTDGGFISKGESPLKYKVKRHFMGAASYWLSPSEQATDYIVYYGADRNRTYIYPFTSLTKHDIENANILSSKEKKDAKQKLAVKERYMILSVGRFSYENGYGKGYDTLMKVARELDESIGVYIVGDEPTQEFIDWKDQENLKHVHFVGFMDKAHLADYYAAADVFVLLTKRDVWGLVINEAMTFGLPIITTKQCGAGLALVDDDNGYLIDVDDVQLAVTYIKDLCDNDIRREIMGRQSRNKIESYSIDNMVYEHLRIWGGIIETK